VDRYNETEGSKQETSIASRSQHWLVNIRSGNGAGEELLAALHGVDGVFAEAINFQDLPSQIRSSSPDALIVVAGGDGTFSAVCGTADAKDRAIACIPLGTANDLAREFSLDRLLRGAPYRSYPSLIRKLPLGRCAVWTVEIDGTRVPCINYVSVGYEGAVVRDFSAWRARSTLQGRLLNRIAYTIYGLRHGLYRITGPRVDNDAGESRSCSSTTGLIVTNIQSHLGLGLSNTLSDPSDATIECVNVSTVLGFLRMMLASVGIGHGLPLFARGGSLIIKNIPPQTPVQIDGESHPSLERGELSVEFRHFINAASARKSRA
jgi:hypothetical protein